MLIEFKHDRSFFGVVAKWLLRFLTGLSFGCPVKESSYSDGVMVEATLSVGVAQGSSRPKCLVTAAL